MNLRSLRFASFAAVLGLASTCSLAVAQTTGTSTSGGGTTGGTTSSSSSGVGSGSGIGSSGSGSGSSGGTSGSGSTSPFVGGVQSGFGTQSTAGMTTTGASSTSAPTAANPFQQTYVNPYAVGVSAGTSTGTTAATKAFGAAVLYTATTNAKYNTGSSTISTVNSNAGQGFTTLALPRSIPYATGLSEDVPLVAHVPSAMTRKLSDVLARSSMLTDRGRMRVDVQGNVVVLLGTATTDRQRQLAERLVRLEPGVFDVQNRITVAGQPNPNLSPLSPTDVSTQP